MAKVKEITWQQAEKLVGKRLDRRRRYARDGKILLELIHWTGSCSWCFEGGDYHVGSGCSECGYQGKVRHSMWVPHTSAEAARNCD